MGDRQRLPQLLRRAQQGDPEAVQGGMLHGSAVGRIWSGTQYYPENHIWMTRRALAGKGRRPFLRCAGNLQGGPGADGGRIPQGGEADRRVRVPGAAAWGRAVHGAAPWVCGSPYALRGEVSA